MPITTDRPIPNATAGTRGSSGHGPGVVEGSRRISRAMWHEAVRDLKHIDTRFETDQATVDRVEDGHLKPISRKVLAREARELEDPILWVDDGWCAYRALMSALDINNSVKDAKGGAAAIAIAEGPSGDQVPGWSYHAAAVVQVKGESEPRVIDHALFREPVPLSTWARRMQLSPESIQIRSLETLLPPDKDDFLELPTIDDMTQLSTRLDDIMDPKDGRELLGDTWHNAAIEGSASNTWRRDWR